MDQPDTEVPKELHSEYEGRPFQSCTRCGETLADFEDGYQISKIYRAGECVMEYAICTPCHSAMVADYSEDSREKMEKFQDENVQIGLGLNTCAVCNTARDDSNPLTEYGLGAICVGSVLAHDMMVCGVCSERMQALISKETRDSRDRFIGENFPCAPNESMPEPSGVPMF